MKTLILFLFINLVYWNNYAQDIPLDKLQEPINFKNLKPNERFDFTAGGLYEIKYDCENIKSGYLGQYVLFDKKSDLKSPIVGTIHIYNKGLMSNWKFDDEDQKIMKLTLKSDVLTLWESIKIGNDKNTVDEYFSNMNKVVKQKGNLISYIFKNFMIDCYFTSKLLSEITITRVCNKN